MMVAKASLEKESSGSTTGADNEETKEKATEGDEPSTQKQ